jgi:hypothetical protein
VADKVYLYNFGVGTLFGGKTFTKSEAEQKAKKFIKDHPGEIVQLVDPISGSSIKTFH